MFEFNGVKYELKMNLERLKLIEKAIGKPILTVYTEHNGAFSIEEMEAVFMVCLKQAGSDFYCNNRQAREIFAQVIQKENGWRDVNNMITQMLTEDTPFLFPNVV